MDARIWSCGFLPCVVEKSSLDILDLLHLEKCDKQLNVLLGTRSTRTNLAHWLRICILRMSGWLSAGTGLLTLGL